MILGQVSHEYTRNPIKKVIISLAPFFGVSFFILILVKLLLPDLYASHISGFKLNFNDLLLNKFLSISSDYLHEYYFYYQALWQNLDFSSWRTYLFIYLALSLGSHIAPSKTDLRYTFEGVGILLVIFIILYFLFKFLKLAFIWQVFTYLSYPVYLLNTLLGYGIVFALLMLALVLLFGGVRKLIQYFNRL